MMVDYLLEFFFNLMAPSYMSDTLDGGKQYPMKGVKVSESSVGAPWATVVLFLQFVANICLHKLETNKILSVNILLVVIWKSGYTFREGQAEGIEFCWGPACDVRPS